MTEHFETWPHRTAAWTQAILDDRERERPSTAAGIPCFSCGRSFLYRGPTGDNSGRFCPPRCREWCDAGNPASDPTYASKSNPRWYSLPTGRHGFLIACAGCGKTLDSKGLRCCSTACEQTRRRRQENAETLSEIGMEMPTKRKCRACGGDIPNWQGTGKKRRRTRADALYCSAKCSKNRPRESLISPKTPAPMNPRPGDSSAAPRGGR